MTDDKTITITELESAINFWRNRLPAKDDVFLCAEASLLCELYGEMIYRDLKTVFRSSLTEAQQAVLKFSQK